MTNGSAKVSSSLAERSCAPCIVTRSVEGGWNATLTSRSPEISRSVYNQSIIVHGVPVFVVFMDGLIHEFKNPTNNKFSHRFLGADHGHR